MRKISLGIRRKMYPNTSFEDNLIKALTNYLDILKQLHIEPPIIIQLSLTNIKNYKKCKSSQFAFDEEPILIYKDIIQLPTTIIENYELSSDQILHNIFDALSNACGLPKSPNYGDDGHWVRR